MARFVGGPTTEFINGRLITIRGFAGSVPMSMIATESVPGPSSCRLPSSPKTTLLSMPTSMYSGIPEGIGAVVAQAVRSVATAIAIRIRIRLSMVSSLFGCPAIRGSRRQDSIVRRVGCPSHAPWLRYAPQNPCRDQLAHRLRQRSFTESRSALIVLDAPDGMGDVLVRTRSLKPTLSITILEKDTLALDISEIA